MTNSEWCDCGRLNANPCDVCRSLACDDAPKLAHEMAHANIGSLLFQLRDTVNSLIAIRVREFGPLLDGEEGELIQIAGSLNFLLTDIKASRTQANAQHVAKRCQDKLWRMNNNGST